MSDDYQRIERLLNERQVADLIGVSVATIRHWRHRGKGPSYLKIGPLVRYDPRAIQRWLGRDRPAVMRVLDKQGPRSAMEDRECLSHYP